MYADILLMLALAGPNLALEVSEIDGMLTVSEPVNMARMATHAQIWASDLRQADKLDSLTAATHVQELSLLVDTLSKLSNIPFHGDVSPDKRDNNSFNNFNNSHRRTKRNILGQFLQLVTGVATTDDLHETLKAEQELKAKITSALTRQTAFEKTLSMAFANISREEESLMGRLQGLTEQHHRDRTLTSKLMTHYKIFIEDLSMLEDILEAVWTGMVNARHSTYLSSRAGLHGVATFQYLDTSTTDSGPTFRYTTRLFRTAEVESVIRNGQDPVILQTPSRIYYLHPSHDLTLPLTEQEVCANRSPCPECAMLVHLGRGTYKVHKGGVLTCKTATGEVIHNLTAG